MRSPAFYKLFENIFPLSKAKYTSNRNFAELKIQYAANDFKQQGLFLLVATVTGFTLYKVLPWLLDLRLSFVADQVILVGPSADMTIIISLFSAFLVAIPITYMILKWQLKEDYAEYLAYINLKYKFDTMKLLKYIITVYAVIIGLLLLVFFDSYSAFGQQKIQLNNAFSLGTKNYKYADIRQIKIVERLYAPNGNIVNDPHYIVEFADGKKWNSREDGFGKYDQDKQIIDLIRSKTNVEPVKMEFEE